VDPQTPLAQKLACGKEFLQAQRAREQTAANPAASSPRPRKATSTVRRIRQ
jgi:hypothetical protein